ncbi:cupin [Paraburkholderia fungorum]|uniref:cupin n=1 Tax=Paraburkholderia fungorum TaxID=134537 RepID=UPI00209813FF|nr:cupin [Paraburkholderia fungorum]USX06821.1 cupin [Paraburkholderia fungorum]
MRNHIEMAGVDLESGWIPLKGIPGLEVKYLANDLDDAAGTGARTRFVRFSPGAKTPCAFVHTYWEEFYLLSGDLTSPIDSPEAQTMQAPRYSLRPPGTPHGPMSSAGGAIALELQYFVK